MDLERDQSEVIENENESSREGLLNDNKSTFKRRISTVLGTLVVLGGLHVAEAVKNNINPENEMDQDDKIAFIENQRSEAEADTRRAKIVRAIRTEE